jgi:phospholipase C
MTVKHLATSALQAARTGLVSVAVLQLAVGNSFAAPPAAATGDNNTATPIKHVIVIIGENRSFDHVFATYVPPKKGETINNLLSEGIVNADGTPGWNFKKAEQQQAHDTASDGFLLNPNKAGFPKGVLPAPLVGGPKDSYIPNDSLTLATKSENGLPSDYYAYLVTGGTGQTSHTPDARITNVAALPPGPFQLTNGATFSYNDYSASPVHRFYQMWQQLNCAISYATPDNPSGCAAHLFSWVETTVGAGANGIAQPANFSTNISPALPPPARVRPLSAFTTCRMVTFPTSNSSPRNTRSAITSTSR